MVLDLPGGEYKDHEVGVIHRFEILFKHRVPVLLLGFHIVVDLPPGLDHDVRIGEFLPRPDRHGCIGVLPQLLHFPRSFHGPADEGHVLKPVEHHEPNSGQTSGDRGNRSHMGTSHDLQDLLLECHGEV